jgi:FkbM family methyltransferase
MSLQGQKEKFLNKETDKWSYIDAMYEQHALLFEYSEFLPQTNISKIEIVDGDVIMTFRDSGLKFICTKNDKRLAPFDTLNFGRYEAEELQMQKNLMDPGNTILDIGGNYGWYAMHIGQAYPTSKVYSFEPIPRTFQHLVRNLEINKIGNVQPQPFGLSDSAGSFEFFYDPNLSVNASLQNLTGKDSVESVTCVVNTLDGFWIPKKEKADFIKCDVEGAELLVFKGAGETLKRDKPIIFSEMLRKWTAKFNYHPNEIIELLRSYGYEVFSLEGEKLAPFGTVNEDTTETNYFFLHKEAHAAKITKFTR